MSEDCNDCGMEMVIKLHALEAAVLVCHEDITEQLLGAGQEACIKPGGSGELCVHLIVGVALVATGAAPAHKHAC